VAEGVVVEVIGACLRGRTQVVKVVHPLKRAKRRLEKRQAATGLGIVVNLAKWVVS
jgi:hypothetical protein